MTAYLDYGKHRKRRTWPYVVIGIIVFLGVSWLIRECDWQRLEGLLLIRTCCHYVMHPTQVIYEVGECRVYDRDDRTGQTYYVAEKGKLVTLSPVRDYVPYEIAVIPEERVYRGMQLQPQCWRSLQAGLGFGVPDGAVVFLHECFSPDGTAYLVMLELHEFPDQPRYPQLVWATVKRVYPWQVPVIQQGHESFLGTWGSSFAPENLCPAKLDQNGPSTIIVTCPMRSGGDIVLHAILRDGGKVDVVEAAK